MLIPIESVQEIDKLKDFNTRILEAAKLYTKHGFTIVPLRRGSKRLPAKASGINYFSGTNKPDTAQKWFKPGGPWEGCNIGFVCGADGLPFVVDLDVHGQVDGIAAWHKLEAQYGDIACPVAQTPSGGQHLVMAWRENFMTGVGKLGPGIDTRGGTGKPGSHIVVWPSRTDDGDYSWVHGGEVPDAPDWIRDEQGMPWKSKVPGRGNEGVTDSHMEEQYSPSTIATMLDYIDPNDVSYEEWLFIGQAVNSQLPGEEGLDLWDKWSARGERYIPDECTRRWTGFNPSGSIRVGTLIYFAKQNGYRASVDDMARQGDFAQLVQDMNENNAVILVGGKVRIAHRDTNENVHILGPRDFYTLMYNRSVSIPGEKKRSEADIWMAHPDRRECVRGMGFFPGKELWEGGYVNMWRGWGAEPIKGDWSLFYNHVHNILCRGEEELTTFVFDWVADMLQDPMRPKGTALVFHGKEGTGKGTFCDVVGRMIGRKHYKHVTNERHLTGNFNYHLMDALFVFADEVIFGGSRSTAGILKSMVSEKELVCERKGVDSFMYENRARIAVASNEDWFIPAGPNSRRWLVLDVSGEKASDRQYFDALYDQMENGGYNAMMYDLEQREITSNLHLAPVTESLKLQRAIYRFTGDSVDQWLDDCVAMEDLGVMDTGEGKWPDEVDRMELYEAYRNWTNQQKSVRTKGAAHFYKKVEYHGFEKYRPRARGGVRKWRYRVPALAVLQEES